MSQSEWAVLDDAFLFRPELACFLPVRIESGDDGRVMAIPVETNTSGDFASLSGTDGYVELPPEQNEFPAGTIVRLHRWFNP